MPHLEPTYLRYIYDGLVKGSIHPENAAELPDGLIGLYEEAFDERTSVVERQKLLQRFTVWSLLKKEVSAAFVAEVLGEPEEEILNFISTYSSWFNSPESGKYQLYHERLKVYLLQKLSEQEIQELHEKLIARLEQAIEEQKVDEFEWYGLEFLAVHLSVEAMLSGDGKKLLDLAYSQTHWQRQLKISKGYTWTKNGLKEVMSWASKYNKDEVIECGLQMVDLHHQEQNAAPQIVALVAEGDFDAALKRIEQFGGNDKEGLQRKFILYMLCLMELTILDSKDKAYRKEGIEKLLKHLDENIPAYQPELINWNDFFPSYLMFQMACEWAELGLEYLIVFNRTDTWDAEWIKEKGPYSDLQFKVLKECASYLYNDNVLRDLSIELAKQRIITEAIECCDGISVDWQKISTLSCIATELANKGLSTEANRLMIKAYDLALHISVEWQKSIALLSLSNEFAKQNQIKQAIQCACGINDELKKSKAFLEIVIELSKQGKIRDAFDSYNSIIYELDKGIALNKIFTELVRLGELKKAQMWVRGKSDIWEKSCALSGIATELAKLGKYTESLECACDISDDWEKSQALASIATELALRGQLDRALESTLAIPIISEMISPLIAIAAEMSIRDKQEKADDVLQEAVACAQEIINDFLKNSALKDISIEQLRQGKIDKAFETALGINDESERSEARLNLVTELVKREQLVDALNYLFHFSSDWQKSRAVLNISNELSKQGKITEIPNVIYDTSKFSRVMHSDNAKSGTLSIISFELAKQGKINLALEIARNTSDDFVRINSTLYIYRELAKQGLIEKADEVMQEVISFVHGISDQLEKSRILPIIATELARNGKIEESTKFIQESLECARKINVDWQKRIALIDISTELSKQGNLADADSVMQEASKYFENIISERRDSDSLTYSATELNKRDDKKEAKLTLKKDHKNAHGVINESDTSISPINKVTELTLHAQFEEAVLATRSIGDNYWKSSALKFISTELARQGDWRLAEKTSLEIPQIAERHKCWKKIAKHSLEQLGHSESLLIYKVFNNEEARLFYLKGWVENIQTFPVNLAIVTKATYLLNEDINSIEHLLQLHALNQLFFEVLPEEKIHRFNRTLNLQWAIDIKNQLPN